MGQNIIYNDESLSYDEVCDKFKYVEEECSIHEEYSKNREEITACVSQYTKEEVENMLKDCISRMVQELEQTLKKENKNIKGMYSTDIQSWNETLACISINENILELKLTNDFICDGQDDINYLYITLYKNGKGVFTECIERIREEYEFTGVTFVPINENEIYFKAIDKKEFIDRILDELK